VHKVDPLARQVGKSSELLGRREPLRLEAPHLTRRSRAPLRRFAADNPAHSRIVAQAFGRRSYPVSGKATKYRLPEQPGAALVIRHRSMLRKPCVIHIRAVTPMQMTTNAPDGTASWGSLCCGLLGGGGRLRGLLGLRVLPHPR
jgi:hypothetical protein